MKPFEGYEKEDYSNEWMIDIAAIESFQAIALAQWLYNKFTPLSVIDFGCGPGVYLTGFKVRGCEVHGLDANVDACGLAGLDESEVTKFDLRLPYGRDSLIPKKDIALCLEVAEHLPVESAETLIDTLTSWGHRIVFSAATPGQGGLHHYNERAVDYWLGLFKKRGYALDPVNDEFQIWLRGLTKYRQQNRVCGWLIDHTFILSQN